MTVTSYIGFMDLNLAFTITCDQKAVYDCNFSSENCNTDFRIPKFSTKIIYIYIFITFINSSVSGTLLQLIQGV